MKKIVLKGPRIIMRPYRLSDAPTFYKWFKDREVIKYLMAPPPKSLKEEIKFVRKSQRRKNGINFAVENERGTLIGSAGIGFEVDDGTATLGILIGEKKDWGKGYGTEMVVALTDLAFKNKKIHRVQLKTSVDNRGAVRLYTKVGFKKEGILRLACKNPVLKRFDDEYSMSILRSEWLKKNKLKK